MAASAKQAQPAKKATPPKGVMTPNHLGPARLSRYKLPEKSKRPATKHHPATVANTDDGHLPTTTATANRASA